MKDELGIRMKENYEMRSRTSLMRRNPVILRLDGCHFHTFTRGFEKPFDRVLNDTMAITTKRLCENIQDCVFGYTQSDEITLVLCDYQKLETDAWYDYEVQKMCSVEEMGGSQCNNEVLDKLKEMEKKEVEHNANSLWKGLEKFKDN